MTVSAYVGLGSNVGDRLGNLRRSVEALDASEGIRFVRCSSVYETDPVGPPQPDFLNAVIEVHTDLSAPRLLERLKDIERELGRTPGPAKGPRTADLDLLLYSTDRIDTPGLHVPHPEMSNRAFVLVPLAEIAPFAKVGQARVAQLLEEVDRSGVRPAHPSRALWPAVD